MKRLREVRARWLLVFVFAVGMAWVEAACVYYLRLIVDRIEPYQANPLPMRGNLQPVELVREAATLVMLLTVGALAGGTRRVRLGYTAIAFGVWDIFYYLFLRMICGWPRSMFDWDVLFLLPLPWWGPVLAPVCIASLMIAWGTLVSQHPAGDLESPHAITAWRVCWLGIALALYVFMADSLRARDLPTTFNWPLFAVALALMAAPVAEICFAGRARQGNITES
jgi:hypothetical protein